MPRETSHCFPGLSAADIEYIETRRNAIFMCSGLRYSDLYADSPYPTPDEAEELSRIHKEACPESLPSPATQASNNTSTHCGALKTEQGTEG